MYLLYGVLCLCFAALLFAVTLLGVRNPDRPIWAGQDVFAIILTPLILGLFVVGIACCAKAFMADVLPGFLEWSYVGMTAVVTVVSIKLMGIRTKLTAFSAAETKRGKVVPFDSKVNSSPETPINDTPNFRKAA